MNRTLTFAFLITMLPAVLMAGGEEPAPVFQQPRNYPLALWPRVQKDGHSCGYLALAAVYQSYGMIPYKARLRSRLGTDEPAVPFLKDTKGTIQPDLFRVLAQDGFEAETVNPRRESGRKRLISHLNSRQYALTLIKRKSTGGLHWIVLTGYRKGLVTVADSLLRGKRRRNLNKFAKKQILSSVLLTPRKLANAKRTDKHKKNAAKIKKTSKAKAHRQGVGQMIMTYLRSLF